MIYKIELHPEAENELHDSFNWYENRAEGLGLRFFNEVSYQIEIIKKYPDRFSKRYNNFREAALKKFPFIIIFEVFEKEKLVFISYIFHTKRNPAMKYKRRKN